MTTPLWVATLIAIFSGAFGGIVGPVIANKLAARRWRTQKQLELKYSAFIEALDAIAAWEADALDPKLQSEKVSYEGRVLRTNKRAETVQALGRARGLIDTWYDEDVRHAFNKLSKTEVSLDSVPYTEFEEARVAFVDAAVDELGIERAGYRSPVMVRALKIAAVGIMLLVGMFAFVVVFSASESTFACNGKYAIEDQRRELYLRLEEYRWWVGLWSDSDGSLWIEVPNEFVEYYSDLNETGPEIQIRANSELVGNFSKISKVLAIQTPDGFFDGQCERTK